MDLNPHWQIPDHLDTVLPSGRTVREAAGARLADKVQVRVAVPGRRGFGWLARLFGGR